LLRGGQILACGLAVFGTSGDLRAMPRGRCEPHGRGATTPPQVPVQRIHALLARQLHELNVADSLASEVQKRSAPDAAQTEALLVWCPQGSDSLAECGLVVFGEQRDKRRFAVNETAQLADDLLRKGDVDGVRTADGHDLASDESDGDM
jgi:hypothetical protein